MLSDKKVLLIIAPENFRDEEYFKTKDVLDSKGIATITASAGTGEIRGMLGGTVTPDKTLDDVSVDEYDAVVFVGGTGAAAYFNDSKALNIAKQAYEKGKVLAAICIAPSILANAGILQDKSATSYPSEQGNLENRGAKYTGEQVTSDGKIITGKGPEAATRFGDEIAKALSE